MKFTQTVKRAVAGFLSLLMLGGTAAAFGSVLPASAAEPETYRGTAITKHSGGYDHFTYTPITYSYDFSMDRIGFYAIDPTLALSNRGSADLSNGHLTTKEGKELTFGSAVTVGDDYGMQDGYVRFDLRLTGGEVLLGLRTGKTTVSIEDCGIWFIFNKNGKIGMREPVSGTMASVQTGVTFETTKTITLHDERDTLTLYADDTVLAMVRYDQTGYLAFCTPDGEIVAKTETSKVAPAGFFQLNLNRLNGYIDNVVFTHVETERVIPETRELRVVDYSTWTATDGLDRTVADNAIAGDPKANRYVGLFYFLCNNGAAITVNDNTKDYLKVGGDRIKEYIENRGSGANYWAEPYFGYYRNTDEWVYRKHAYMFEQAGVDFIYLDVSNAVTYPEGHVTLFDTWLQMRREGIDTPQIVFFNGDQSAHFNSNMKELFDTVYSDENWDKYRELFFEWEGKPLIFGNIAGVSADLKKKIQEKFTIRGSWAWTDKNNYWPWLQEYIVLGSRVRLSNGGWGRDANGKYESLSVALGHHPSTSKGRSYVNGRQPNNGLHDFEFSSIERAGLGLCFESQFNAVQTLLTKEVPAEDPFVMMITGWNEWTAGSYKKDTLQNMANTTSYVQYIDQFNPEFSRDAEPMRNVDGYGIGDHYYYQMVDYIRRYKGIAKTPVADHQGSINIYDLSSWDKIETTYMDSLYDTMLRNETAYDARERNFNNTGRNDFDYAKVSQDDYALYFLVKTSHDIVIDSDETWMNLYLNTDGDLSTGWEGYDYILNRDRDSFAVTVEKYIGNTYETEIVGAAYYYLEGDSMAIRLAKDLVGVSGKADKLIFKWADHADVKGDPMAFMDLGDTAPDNRFGFLYLCEDYQTSQLPAVSFDSSETSVTTTTATVPAPSDDIHITVEDVTVDTLFDLKDIPAGTMVADTAMNDYFEHAKGTGDSYAEVREENGRKFIRITRFTDLRTWNDVEGPYEVSADIHMVNYGNSAIYVRGEMPGAYAPTNPKNANVKQVFNYFEWDWYSENGGKTFGGSSTAGSGIGIYPGQNNITIRVKRYAEDGLGVASASYTFPYSDAFKPDADGWFKLRCVDDGDSVFIYFNDVLMCSAKMEDPGVIYDSDGTMQEYYGKVTLMDNTGKEVLVVENTRVNSTGSQIAMTTRGQTMEFSNIYITYKTQNAIGGVVRGEMLTSSTHATYTPDDRLLTTLSFGTQPPPDNETAAPVEDDSDAPAIVTSPVTDAPTSPESTPSGSAAPDTEPTNEKGCGSSLPAVVCPILLICAAAFTRRRPKERV